MSPLLLAGCLARDCMLHDGATSSAFRITLRFALWLLSNTALACCSLARQGNRQVARGLRLVWAFGRLEGFDMMMSGIP